VIEVASFLFNTGAFKIEGLLILLLSFTSLVGGYALSLALARVPDCLTFVVLDPN